MKSQAAKVKAWKIKVLDNLRSERDLLQILTVDIDFTGYTASNGTVSVKFPTSTPSSSQLLRSVNGWLIILSRLDANFPLNQTWTTYKSGFGDIGSNFWLGLERIYRLTNSAVNGGRTYRIRFLLQSLQTAK
jgi:Fibrinogen beta and gamma chains, C-terminal globular domain